MGKVYEVFATDTFWKDYENLSKNEKEKIDKIK